MGARLKDIANHLNLSISTVSYALNGGPRPVTDEVRESVQRAAQELGYRPNRIARSLATRRTMTIGVVPTVVTQNLTLGPYFQSCFTGIVNESENLGYDVLVFTRDVSDPGRLADLLLDGRIDGAIFLAPRRGSPILARLGDAGLPFCSVGTTEAESGPSVRCENARGVETAVRHLAELGHERIAHLHGSLDHNDGVERLDAFRNAMTHHGLNVRADWTVDGGFQREIGYAAARRLLRQGDRPTAIVCGSDEIAVGAFEAAWELGLRIPEDLSVVGFDDAPAAEIVLPRLTTVRQPMNEMGVAALGAVVDLLSGKAVENKVFPTELVIRRSTARPTKV